MKKALILFILLFSTFILFAETGQPARYKSYYNIFIKSGETITYVLFDNSSISNTLDDDIKEKDRQTAVKLLDLIGIGIYTFLWEDV